MPDPKTTFEKIYIKMYCNKCRHYRAFAELHKMSCALPAVIQDACMSENIETDRPGFMYSEKER